MAQSTVTNDGIQLVNPGTYVSTKVQAGQGNIASAGVVTLIGEADEGPGWQDEAELDQVAYTPDQYAEVLLKYGSGNLVEAFRQVIAAANDPNIVGAINLVRFVKTNRSVAAGAMISRTGFGEYASLEARRRGAPGNLIKYRSEVGRVESAPDTGQVAMIPTDSGFEMAIRINGGSQKSVVVGANDSPADACELIEDYERRILATGGQSSAPTQGKTGLSLSASASDSTTLVIQLQTGNLWASAPSAGDVLVIPAAGFHGASSDSVIAGAGGENIGSYVVIGVTNSASLASITAKRVTSGSCVSVSGSVAQDAEVVSFKQIRIRNMSGMDRQSNVGISGQYTIVSNDGTNVIVQLPVGESWNSQPQVGDCLLVEAAFGGLNAGFYGVVGSSASTVSFYRLSNGSAGDTSAPANIVSPITEETQPFMVLKSVIDGLGKSMEILGSLESVLLNASTLSGAGLSNKMLVSSAEYQNVFTVSKQSQSEAFSAGGEIVISIGCTAEQATVEVSSSGVEIKEAGSSVLSAAFSQVKTLNDLASLINSQEGWSASVASSRFGLVNPNKLDRGSFDATGAAGMRPARLKRDASQWAIIVGGSTLVSASLEGQSGLPETISPDKFLSGGSKQGTTSAEAVAAIDAVEKLDTNFINTLFSRDAAEDINDGLTESSSTYTIDAINAYLSAHVIKMSAVKMRKNRIAMASKRSDYSSAKDAAGDLSNFRCAMAFQDMKTVSADGTIKQFQPWMTAVVASGMSAAAGYKGVVKKFANITGIISPMGDFNPRNPGESEDALKSGLMFIEPVATGGFRWVSDQTTYTIDNNFVYNSVQAVYLSDLITLTLIDRFDRAVVGQSVADITAGGALGVLAGEMFNFKRLKWIAASDDAPEGYKNAKARLRGGVLELFCEVKLAGLIYFVPIYLTVSQVQQDAG